VPKYGIARLHCLLGLWLFNKIQNRVDIAIAKKVIWGIIRFDWFFEDLDNFLVVGPLRIAP
jgi:hypothetical protein